jgi:hypothetical protein
MNVVLIAICFLLAAQITFSRGAGPAFAFVYLPSVLLFSEVRKLSLPGFTDASPVGATIYGILLAGILAQRRLRLRVTVVDCVVVLLLCAYATSAVMNAHPWRAVSIVGSMALNVGFLAYFIVRIVFQQQAPPRQALDLLVATISVICVFALIEFRLWPETYGDVLRSLGLMGPAEPWMAMRRYGFFRANASFSHSIDLGIGAALVFAMIAMFSWRLGIAVTRVRVLGGLALALIASFCAISFSAFMGLGCALLLYLALIRFPSSRRLLPAAVAMVIVVGFVLTARLATMPMDELERPETPFAGSLRNRVQLMQLCWNTTKRAGLFGFGDRSMLPDEVNRSVDNAYLLIAMKRGWVALGLWLALPVSLAALASRGLRKTRSRRQVQLILAGFSAVVGTMIAMYTVWFGFVYPQLLMTVLAFTVNESQAAIRAPRPSHKPRGAARAMEA